MNTTDKIKSIIIVAKNRIFSYKFFLATSLVFFGFPVAWNIYTARTKKHVKNIENVKFAWDIHDVLCKPHDDRFDWSWESIKKAYSSRPKQTKWAALKNLWDKKFSSKKNSSELITQAEEAGDVAFAEFLKDIHANWIPDEEVFNMVRELKQKGYKQYICSNIPEQSYKILSEKYPDHFGLFNGEFVTGPGTTRKPNPEFFKQFLKKFNLKAEEVLFIDDKKKNCQSARKLGMKAFVFKGPRTLQKIYNLLHRHNQKSIAVSVIN